MAPWMGLQASLKRAGAAIGTQPGFSVRDLHKSDGKMAIVVDTTTYAGILDAGVVPYSVAGASCMRQLRVGLELKQTQEQKDLYKANHPAGKSAIPDHHRIVAQFRMSSL